MGVIISSLTKPLRSFNIENRAQKVFNKPKPIPSPCYPSTADQLRIAKEVNPNFMEDHYKKDEILHDRLKEVFVSSHVQQDVSSGENSGKQLPHCRTLEDDFDYGFWEPPEVPIGRCYLKTSMQFMTDHLKDPDKHTAEYIASQYRLQPKDVGNILAYYRVFQIVKNKSDGTITVAGNEMTRKIEDK